MITGSGVKVNIRLIASTDLELNYLVHDVPGTSWQHEKIQSVLLSSERLNLMRDPNTHGHIGRCAFQFRCINVGRRPSSIAALALAHFHGSPGTMVSGPSCRWPNLRRKCSYPKAR